MHPCAHSLRRLARLLLPALLLLALPPACGDGGGSSRVAGGGIGGTGISGGAVTGFGSFFVTGTEWRLGPGATVEIDGERRGEGALELGMFAVVEGVRASDGRVGTARRVRVDPAVLGPIGGPTVLDVAKPDRRTLSVMGQSVEADRGRTVFVGTTFEDLAEGDVIEVFGPVRGDGARIRATRIVKIGELVLGETEVEIRGQVAGLIEGTSFALGSVGVALDDCDGGPTGLDPAVDPLANGMQVEVEGILREPLVVDACSIRPFTPLSSALGDDAENVEIEGVIEDFADLAFPFTVNGLEVDASGAALEPDLPDAFRDGVLAEVEGDVVGGVLVARRLDLEEGEARISAELAAAPGPDADEIVLLDDGAGRVVVEVGPSTRIEGDDGGSLTLSGIRAGDFLDIRGIDLGDGRMRATDIEVEDGGNRVELRGRVGAIDTDDRDRDGDGVGFTLLGVSVELVQGRTELPDGATVAEFLNALSVGDLVEAANDGVTLDTFGVAGQVELEDD